MYQYEKNHIEINNNSCDFQFNIRTVIQHGKNYVVLLSIPFNQTEINNIYCMDAKAKLLWRSEDLSMLYPKLKNLLPYEQMEIKDDIIFASDFYGRNYKINANDGKIEGFDMVK
jgi:hypothetical protein|nr:hypothetical protein [uncultured Treponema sp.]